MPGFIIPLDIAEDLNRGEKDESDYRPVPDTDRGNASYSDRGMLGFYSPRHREQWGYPDGIKLEGGFGATDAELRRGYAEPDIRQSPAYDLSNYKDRLDQPRTSDVRPGDVEAMESDYAFRQRHRETRGFLTRPRIPRERG